MTITLITGNIASGFNSIIIRTALEESFVISNFKLVVKVHARRKFVEALDKELVEGSVAAKVLGVCNKIFILKRIFEAQ